MCLQVKKKFKTYEDAENACKNPKIAKRDITVWKLLNKDDNGDLHPPYSNRYMIYTKGEKYNSEISSYIHHSGEVTIEVDKGLHSFRNLVAFIFYRYINYGGNRHYLSDRNCAWKYVLFKCTIPTGSKYFIGIEGEMVSDTLIIG